MSAATFILLLLSAVCFLIAVILGHARPAPAPDGSPPTWHRTNFVALGLLLWVVSLLLAAWPVPS
jgi:hypothetical protein